VTHSGTEVHPYQIVLRQDVPALPLLPAPRSPHLLPQVAGTRALIVHRASDVTPEKIEWLWPGRIAIGKLSLIGGSPGLGKSQITTFLAATASNGGDWPCGEGQAPLGSTILLSAEDGMKDTIIPRLTAANADLDRVYLVAAVAAIDGSGRRMFNLKANLDLLEKKITEVGDVRLVVIDPVSAYMGGADGNGNVETREILEPISELASRLSTAVVAITHLNKGGGATKQTALHRFVGSIAFAAAARTAFVVVQDAEEKENRLFLHVKNNIGPQCKGLSFRLEQIELDGGVQTSKVVWGTEHISHSADSALAAAEGHAGDNSAKTEYIALLQTILANGPMLVLDVERHAIEAGLLPNGKSISQSKPFRSARKVLGIEPKREPGVGGRWILELPTASKMPSGDNDAPPLEMVTLATGHVPMTSDCTIEDDGNEQCPDVQS
jgi:putative DNA primase/helicase